MKHKTPKRLDYDRKYRSNHKKQIEQYQAQIRVKRKKKAIEYKGSKCQMCGYDRCLRALTFHHRDPNQKVSGVTEGIRSNWSWRRLQIELDKCDLLCANCHMEIEEQISLQATSSMIEHMPDERVIKV